MFRACAHSEYDCTLSGFIGQCYVLREMTSPSERETMGVERWSTHSPADTWNQLEPIEIEVSPKARRVTVRRSRKKPVTLRLEERPIAPTKKLARTKSLSYQALMRNWINEGIAREEQLRRRA